MGKRVGVVHSIFRWGIIGVFFAGAGCAEMKQYKQENEQLHENILSLQQENAQLSSMVGQYESELNRLEDSRKALEDKLQGTGATTRIKNGAVSVVLPGSILFDSGQTKLRPQSKATLKKIAEILKSEVPGELVRIEGHTDNEPIKKQKEKFASNWELSTARATTVLHYLVDECGISPTRIYVSGFGENQPIESNDTKTGKAKNRRVEFVLVPMGTGG